MMCNEHWRARVFLRFLCSLAIEKQTSEEMDETVQNGNFHLEAKKKPCNFTPTKQKISEANYNVYNSSKKQTKQI
jgi:hypothetical protein